MEDKKEKVTMNDDLLDKVSGGDDDTTTSDEPENKPLSVEDFNTSGVTNWDSMFYHE